MHDDVVDQARVTQAGSAKYDKFVAIPIRNLQVFSTPDADVFGLEPCRRQVVDCLLFQ